MIATFYRNLDKDIAEKYNLEKEIYLKEIPFKTHEDWLKVRKKTLGGSDIGVVLGLNEYKSKLQLYREKKSESASETSSAFTKKGTDLEGFIFDKWVVPDMDRMGYDVYKPNKMFVLEHTPCISANLDGLAVPRTRPGENIGIEIKWVSQYGTDKWDQNVHYACIPPSYYAQVQQYMYIMNLKRFYVYALFDTDWECKIYEVNRNESFITKLVAEANNFYEHHLLMDIPPKPEITKDSAAIAEMLEKPIEHTKTASEFDDLIAQYLAVKNSAKNISQKEAELLSEIVTLTLDGFVPSTDKFKVKLMKCTATSMDIAKFKEAYPELYKQFQKQSTYTRTIIK